METVGYFAAGLLSGCSIFYVAFIVGRHTSYQDKNIPTPPSPLPHVSIPTISEVINKPKPEEPNGWVTETTDPPLGNYRPGSEL